MGLKETIERCQTHLEKGFIKNEASVRQHIINPILSNLGWNDPSCIQPEFSVEGLKADYALLDDGDVKFFIEAKKPDVNLNISGLEQLFSYGFRGRQAPLLALTNGAEWQFYLTYKERYRAEERIFASLNLRKPSAENIHHLVESFSKYLNRDDVVSGAAYKVADADFELRNRRQKAERDFRKYWNGLLEEPSEDLANAAKGFFENEYNVDLELDTGTIQDLIKNPLLSQPTSTSVVEEIHPSYPSTSRSPAKGLTATYNGKNYTGKAAAVLAAVIRDVGSEKVYRVCRVANIRIRGHFLVMKTQEIDSFIRGRGAWHRLDREYEVSTYSTTAIKFQHLEKISSALGINLTAEILQSP